MMEQVYQLLTQDHKARSNTRQQLHKQIHQLGDQDTRDHTHHQQYMHPMLYDKGNMHVMQCVGDVVVQSVTQQLHGVDRPTSYSKISTTRSRSQLQDQDHKIARPDTHTHNMNTETQRHNTTRMMQCIPSMYIEEIHVQECVVCVV